MKKFVQLLTGERLLVALMAVAVLYVSWRYSTMVAGGSDSYGYISQAEAWTRGSLKIDQPWVREVNWPHAEVTFAPLAYTPTSRTTIVPTYPPGLPLLMAGAALVGGYCAMFWIVPISAAVLVLGTYLLGRRLGIGRAGVVAAALVGSSPVVLYMFVQPMTDVPVAAAWTMMFVLLLGRTSTSAAAAGLMAGLAALIRPNLAPAVAVPLLWFAIDMWRNRPPERGRHLRRGLWFVAGLVPGIVVLAAFNWRMYGSPLTSGYGDVSDLFEWSHALPNLLNYFRWFAETHAWLPLLGFYALIVPGRWPWRDVTDPLAVRMMGLFVFVVWVEYLFYSVFDAWWYLRFLLPCWPFIMIGFAQVALRIAERSRAAAGIVAIVMVVLVVRGVRVGVEEHSFSLWGSERGYVEAAKLVRSLTDENSVILASQHSGSIRFYAGRMTLKFGLLNPDVLDRAIDWFESHGIHPYALLDDLEVPWFKQRFAGQEAATRLSALPVMTYQTAGLTSLYDLSRVPWTHPTLAVREFPHKGSHCTPPAPRPELVIK